MTQKKKKKSCSFYYLTVVQTRMDRLLRVSPSSIVYSTSELTECDPLKPLDYPNRILSSIPVP